MHGVLWGDYDVNPCCRGLKSKIIIRENEIIQGYYHPSLVTSFIYLGYKKGEKWDYLDFNNNNTQLYDFEAINDSLFVSCKNKIRKYYLTEPQPYVYHEPRIITINLDLDLYYLKYLNDTLYGINDNDRETKGLYISDADGGNWQLLYEVDSVNTIEYYKDYIFIGTTSGIEFSSNRGASWERAELPEINSDNKEIKKISISPTGALWAIYGEKYLIKTNIDPLYSDSTETDSYNIEAFITLQKTA